MRKETFYFFVKRQLVVYFKQSQEVKKEEIYGKNSSQTEMHTMIS